MANPAKPTRLTRGGPNALARGLGLLGDEWTLLILRAAMLGATRYGEFRQRLPISYAVLGSRLEILVHEGLLQRHIYQENPLRAEYILTERGLAVWPVLLTIWDWEKQWVPEHVGGSLPAMKHTVCGRVFVPMLSCANCGKRVGLPDVTTEWGPSGSWARSVPDAATRRRSDGRSRSAAGFFPETMAVFGNRWSSAVVGAAFLGLRRYTDLLTALGTPPGVLAARLQILCEHDVLEAVQIQSNSTWAEYRLTKKGRALFPVVVSVLQWAERWYRSPEGEALTWVHLDCGKTFSAVLVCDICGERLHRRTIELVDDG
jgi:DNA-binding HxlR family transcriptional regulator